MWQWIDFSLYLIAFKEWSPRVRFNILIWIIIPVYRWKHSVISPQLSKNFDSHHDCLGWYRSLYPSSNKVISGTYWRLGGQCVSQPYLYAQGRAIETTPACKNNLKSKAVLLAVLLFNIPCTYLRAKCMCEEGIETKYLLCPGNYIFLCS